MIFWILWILPWGRAPARPPTPYRRKMCWAKNERLFHRSARISFWNFPTTVLRIFVWCRTRIWHLRKGVAGGLRLVRRCGRLCDSSSAWRRRYLSGLFGWLRNRRSIGTRWWQTWAWDPTRYPSSTIWRACILGPYKRHNTWYTCNEKSEKFVKKMFIRIWDFWRLKKWGHMRRNCSLSKIREFAVQCL